MKSSAKISMVILLLSAALYGCAVDKVEPPTSDAATIGVISTSMQGSQVASATAQSRELILTSTQLFKRLAEIGLGHLTPTLATTPSGDVVCSDGGAYSYTGTYTAPSTYSLALTFNGCRELGFQLVGDYQLTGTPANFTVTLGDGSTFNIFNFDRAYTTLIAYLKASVSYTITSSGVPPLTSYAINASGSISSFDYFLLNTFDMTMSALRSSVEETTNANLDISTTLVTNGGFSETWASSGSGFNLARMLFTDFTVNKTQLNAATAPVTNYTLNTKSVNGRVSFAFNPRAFGYSGIFDIATPTPIRYSNASPLQTDQGMLTTNGTATINYNAGSDVDIIVSGLTSTLSFLREYELMKITDFAAMEQDKPPLIPPPAPGVPLTLPSGNTLAVTLTWVGPSGSSTSDMDLHLHYYSSPTPTAGAPKTWTVHWSGGKTCTDPVGLPFGDALDLDSDGTCDAGLDFDDTNGYGPEHITDLKLLPGYYIASVDSFGLSSAEYPTTLYLSLHIGDNIVGPYVSTLSTSDGDGSDPAAWYHVADIRVNSDGTIDVLAPDSALPPWD
ncbi:MAG: hypothetical protein A2X58_09680 [Nitrospirae bacterium GWC2_56_14]|nr:MAG: hypothetical protein A2X58_09680 [Nitrospirae bacterium GWC2_56_14]